MSDMREILTKLMGRNGDDAYSLEKRSGVPQPTTQRFLTGKHGDPRSSTVRKWAKVYGVTESQLRGDAPIDGLTELVPRQPQPENQAPVITREQQQVLDLIGRMDPETGALFIKLFDRLVPDRRKKQAKEGARARVTSYGIGESVRRGDLFVKDEPIGRTKNDGDTF